MPPTPNAGPPLREPIRETYGRRLEARRTEAAAWRRIDRRIGDARLLAFALALALAAGVAFLHTGSYWWVLPFGLVFLGLVIAHEPARRRSDRAERAAGLYARGLARLDDQWPGTGVDGLRWLDEGHPYAADLDLFGSGSLFERLCQARTRSGEAMLAGWLTEGAAPATIRERQAAVAELRPCLDLREQIELLGTKDRAASDPDVLAVWGEAPRVFESARVRIAAGVLGGANVAAVIAWFASGLGVLPLLVTMVATVAFSRAQKRRVALALAGLERSARDLRILAGLLDTIERTTYEAPLLGRVRARLETGGHPASEHIARLARLLHLLDTGMNQFFAPVAALLIWRPWLATAVDAWRARHGRAIRDWNRAAGEFEALCSLACYAAENPDDALPEIVEGEARFEAEGLGHPLLPELDCVRNDVRLGNPVRVLVVSGSNMSGKSTLLRTVGTNAVLALAGAPVRATSMRLSPLVPGATLRIQDSLREGRSRFYAEITRVRQVLDLTKGETPVLFLFDEIFHGTNSSDRRIGAEAVLGSLIRSGAIGLATTHDLALAEIADNLGPAAVNVHFADTLVDGEMHFDYRIRQGVVQHSNALALMRSVGLEV
jgi:hypothetical protein